MKGPARPELPPSQRQELQDKEAANPTKSQQEGARRGTSHHLRDSKSKEQKPLIGTIWRTKGQRPSHRAQQCQGRSGNGPR